MEIKDCYILGKADGEKDDLMTVQLDADFLSSKSRFLVDIGSQICLIDPLRVAKHSKIRNLEQPFLAKGLNGNILIDQVVTLKFFNSVQHDFYILRNGEELLGEPGLLGMRWIENS